MQCAFAVRALPRAGRALAWTDALRGANSHSPRRQLTRAARSDRQLHSCVRCSACGRESNCYDPFMDLSLPIPKRFQVTDPEMTRAVREITRAVPEITRAVPEMSCAVLELTLQPCDPHVLPGQSATSRGPKLSTDSGVSCDQASKTLGFGDKEKDCDLTDCFDQVLLSLRRSTSHTPTHKRTGPWSARVVREWSRVVTCGH
eukprot:1729207-Rhodomonas_salina.2